jgi:hypothetical protein
VAYSKVDRAMWQPNEPKWRALALGHAASIAYDFYLTGPHTNSCGLFTDPVYALCGLLRVGPDDAEAIRDQLVSAGLVMFDATTRTVVVPAICEAEFPFGNGNHVKSNKRIAQAVGGPFLPAILAGITDGWDATSMPSRCHPDAVGYAIPIQENKRSRDQGEQENKPEAAPLVPAEPTPSVVADAQEPKRSKREQEYQQVLDLWNSHNPGRPVEAAKYFDSKLKARLKDAGLESVLKVVTWWWTSPAADYLRNPKDRKPYKLDTPLGPEKFSKYLDAALDEEHSAKPNGHAVEKDTIQLWNIPRGRWMTLAVPKGVTAQDYMDKHRPKDYAAEEPKGVHA